jgi:hypothetical protein
MSFAGDAGVASPFERERRRGRVCPWTTISAGFETPHLSPLPFCEGRGERENQPNRSAVNLKLCELRSGHWHKFAFVQDDALPSAN